MATTTAAATQEARVPWERGLESALRAAVEECDYDFDKAAKAVRRLIRVEDVRVKTSTRRQVEMFTATACRLKFASLDAEIGATTETGLECVETRAPNEPASQPVRQGRHLGTQPPRLTLDDRAEALLASLEAASLDDDIDGDVKPVSNSELAEVLAFLESSASKVLGDEATIHASGFLEYDAEDVDERAEPDPSAMTEKTEATEKAKKPAFNRTIRRGTRDEIFAVETRGGARGRTSSNNDGEGEEASDGESEDESAEREAWEAMRKRTKSQGAQSQ